MRVRDYFHNWTIFGTFCASSTRSMDADDDPCVELVCSETGKTHKFDARHLRVCSNVFKNIIDSALESSETVTIPVNILLEWGRTGRRRRRTPWFHPLIEDDAKDGPLDQEDDIAKTRHAAMASELLAEVSMCLAFPLGQMLKTVHSMTHPTWGAVTTFPDDGSGFLKKTMSGEYRCGTRKIRLMLQLMHFAKMYDMRTIMDSMVTLCSRLCEEMPRRQFAMSKPTIRSCLVHLFIINAVAFLDEHYVHTNTNNTLGGMETWTLGEVLIPSMYRPSRRTVWGKSVMQAVLRTICDSYTPDWSVSLSVASEIGLCVNMITLSKMLSKNTRASLLHMCDESVVHIGPDEIRSRYKNEKRALLVTEVRKVKEGGKKRKWEDTHEDLCVRTSQSCQASMYRDMEKRKYAKGVLIDTM